MSITLDPNNEFEAALGDIVETHRRKGADYALDGDEWWHRLPFARKPEVRALAPHDVVGLQDASGQLATRQDVTPMALAHQALIIDASSSPAERAMRGAVKAMQL